MRTGYSILIGAACAGAVFFGVFVFWQAEFATLKLEGEAAELERERQLLLERTATFYQLEKDLADGRLTLVQAAAIFRDLDRERRVPPEIEKLRPLFPGASDGERLCRQLIHIVKSGLELEAPARVAEVVERLEAELQELLARDGNVRLPEPQN
jgi:hypothetical protein